MWSNIILSKGVGQEDTSSHPPSRYKHCGVLVPLTPSSSSSNYDLYIFGGRSGTFPLKDFWRLDLKRGVWTEIRPLAGEGRGEWPPHLQEHSMVVYDSQIFIFGGEISLSYGEDLSPLWIYGVESGVWRRWGVPSQKEYDPGDTGNRLKRKITIKSPELARQALTKTPVGRRGHTATVWNNYMLIYGGYRDLKGSLGDLWAFHFETESWHLFSSHDIHKKNVKPWYFSFNSSTSSPAFPCPRHSHIAALHNGNSLYVHGGMQDLIELADLWRFDLKSRQWTQIKTKYGPGPLHGHVGVVALESLLILAGERGGKAVDEFWRFDFHSEVWERIVLNGCRPCPRIWPWGTVLPMVYKRVSGIPTNSQGHVGGSHPMGSQASPGSAEENKYWWDYDESMAVRPEEGEDYDDLDQACVPQPSATTKPGGGVSNGNGNSSTVTRSSLFSDFTRFTSYTHNDYQALSESNSVCLSEEEASPRPPPSSKVLAKIGSNQCQNGDKYELPGIEEQESHPPPLIDLGDDHYPGRHPVQRQTSSSHSSNSTGNSAGNTPEEVGDENFDPIVDSSIATTTSYSSTCASSHPPATTTRRSESATCLQLNLKKNSVKKSASVRFADVLEPPSTSSSSHFILGRECTSDYSSMEHGMNSLQLQNQGHGLNQGRSGGGPTGFENPNYHGSGSSSLFNHHSHPTPSSSKVIESYELGAMTRTSNKDKVSNSITTSSGVAVTVTPAKSETPYYYQVSTPNYMLLIGGNESHSSQVVSKRQPLAIWRLRVTRDLFATGANPGVGGVGGSGSGNGEFSYNYGNGGRPSSGGTQSKMTLASTTSTGF